MKWLITGADGQLGKELVTLLGRMRSGDDVIALSRDGLDIRDSRGINTLVSDVRPDIIANCSAWTKVDLAERHESEVMAVNAHGPAHLAEALVQIGHGLLIQISTDYVFGADTPGPHSEDDAVQPVGVYARTKALAERFVRDILPHRHAVVRTAWLYGEYGSNFAKTMAERLLTGQPLKIVDDQLGQPTYTKDVALRLVEIACLIAADESASGTFHAVNSGSATWWQLGAAIATLLGKDPAEIKRIPSHDLHLAAPRPIDSRLVDNQGVRWGLTPLRPWEGGLPPVFGPV